MSGTQSSLFGGGSRWITNPKHLPLLAVDEIALNIKTLVGAQSAANVLAFYTAMALEGATTSIATANTYVTIASLTGAGFLFNVVAPTHSAGYIPTFRITVDGTVYTITPTAAQTANWRVVLGPVTNGTSIKGNATASVAGDIISPNNAWDPGFRNARIGGVRQYGGSAADFIGIPNETGILANNMPALRFESSLLIEVKCDLLSAVANDKRCAATYRLDL